MKLSRRLSQPIECAKNGLRQPIYRRRPTSFTKLNCAPPQVPFPDPIDHIILRT